jgi:hypothetical protein
MTDFDMDTVDHHIEQENESSSLSSEKKSHPSSGIEIDALHGLLDSYSTTDMKVN